jgi:hypothetical protein
MSTENLNKIFQMVCMLCQFEECGLLQSGQVSQVVGTKLSEYECVDKLTNILYEFDNKLLRSLLGHKRDYLAG